MAIKNREASIDMEGSTETKGLKRKVDDLTRENEHLRDQLDAIAQSHRQQVHRIRNNVQQLSPNKRMQQQHEHETMLRESADIVREIENSRKRSNLRDRETNRAGSPRRMMKAKWNRETLKNQSRRALLERFNPSPRHTTSSGRTVKTPISKNVTYAKGGFGKNQDGFDREYNGY